MFSSFSAVPVRHVYYHTPPFPFLILRHAVIGVSSNVVVHFLFPTTAIRYPLQQCLALALVLGLPLCCPVLSRGGFALDHFPPPTVQLVAVPDHVLVLFVVDRLWYLWPHTVVEQLVRLVAQRTSVLVDAFVLGWNVLVVAGGRPSLHGAAFVVAMAVPALPSVLFHQNPSVVWSNVR